MDCVDRPDVGADAGRPSGFGGGIFAGKGFRAFWVDAFHDGIKTPEQVDKLIADARKANVNALIVQVGGAGMPTSTERWSPVRRIPPCSRALMRSNT